MSEIPEDIRKAANECVAKFRWNNDNRWHEFVGEAIREERERCAKIAERWDDEHGKTGWTGTAIADLIRGAA